MGAQEILENQSDFMGDSGVVFKKNNVIQWDLVGYNGDFPTSNISLWLFNIATGKSSFFIDKSSCLSSINGPFSLATLNNQRLVNIALTQELLFQRGGKTINYSG
jgi:hypothetical protein